MELHVGDLAINWSFPSDCVSVLEPVTNHIRHRKLYVPCGTLAYYIEGSQTACASAGVVDLRFGQWLKYHFGTSDQILFIKLNCFPVMLELKIPVFHNTQWMVDQGGNAKVKLSCVVADTSRFVSVFGSRNVTTGEVSALLTDAISSMMQANMFDDGNPDVIREKLRPLIGCCCEYMGLNCMGVSVEECMSAMGDMVYERITKKIQQYIDSANAELAEYRNMKRNLIASQNEQLKMFIENGIDGAEAIELTKNFYNSQKEQIEEQIKNCNDVLSTVNTIFQLPDETKLRLINSDPVLQNEFLLKSAD